MARPRLHATTTKPSNPDSAASVAFAARRACQRFSVTWRATGHTVFAIGYPELERLTGLAMATVRSKVSRGGGGFLTTLPDPTTGEPDITTIVRLADPEPFGPPKPHAKRGPKPKVKEPAT